MTDELREKVAGAFFDDTFGGTSDPMLTEMHEAFCARLADIAIALIRPAVLRECADYHAARAAEWHSTAHFAHANSHDKAWVAAENMASEHGKAEAHFRALAGASTPPPPASAQREGGE